MLTVPLLLPGCSQSPTPTTPAFAVHTTQVEALDSFHPGTEAAYIAIVRAENETDLSFKVGGMVELIGPGPGTNWTDGTAVRSGAGLARLKQPDFTNALNSAQAHAELTTKVVERLRKLRASDAISQQELDVTEANWLTARAQLDQAQQNLRDSQLLAALDGVVLARYVNPGVTVAAGQRVLRFGDTRIMSVELGVPDRLVNRFSPGKEFDVDISALEGRPPFRGHVSEVGVAASQEGRLFRVVIKVPNPDGLIRSGMTATVRVGDLAQFPPGAVRIPLSALVTAFGPGTSPTSKNAQLAVFVVTNGVAMRRPIQTGEILKSSILVVAGLQTGETIVTKGASLLYDGAPVLVTSDASATGE